MKVKYPTQIKIKLSVLGNNFDPDLFSKLLGIVATFSVRKGMGVSSTGKPHMWKWTIWEFTTGYRKTFETDYLMTEMLNIFGSKTHIIREFCKKNKCEIGVTVVAEIAYSTTPAFCFTREFLHFLDEIGATLDIDSYILTDKLPDFYGTIDSDTGIYTEDENESTDTV